MRIIYFLIFIEMFESSGLFNVEPSLKSASDVLMDHSRHYADHIITTGFYEHHMYRWLEQFDSRQFFVVNGDDMLVDPGKIVEDLQDFLGVPRLLLRQDFVKDPESGFFCYQSHREEKSSCMPSSKTRTRNGKVKTLNSTMERLYKLYRPHIQRLEQMLGREFPWGKNTW